MSSKNKRKYQPLWEQVKTERSVTVQVQNYGIYSQKQLVRIMKTIRKAVINEKCTDYKYKIAYPDSQLNCTLAKSPDKNIPENFLYDGTIIFTLINDTTDCSKLFK
jgi:hypothetical protein